MSRTKCLRSAQLGFRENASQLLARTFRETACVRASDLREMISCPSMMRNVFAFQSVHAPKPSDPAWYGNCKGRRAGFGTSCRCLTDPLIADIVAIGMCSSPVRFQIVEHPMLAMPLPHSSQSILQSQSLSLRPVCLMGYLCSASLPGSVHFARLHMQPIWISHCSQHILRHLLNLSLPVIHKPLAFPSRLRWDGSLQRVAILGYILPCVDED